MKKFFYIIAISVVLIGTAEAQEPFLSFGTRGNGPGQFWSPQGIFVASEKIYILDSGNHRVQIFSSQGDFLSEFPVPVRSDDGIFPNSWLTGVAVDNQGFVYVTDLEDRSLAKFNGAGDLIGYLLENLEGPEDIAIDGDASLYVLDGSRVLVVSTSGVITKTWSSPIHAANIAVNGDVVYVGGLRWVFRLTRDGRPLGGWGDIGTGNGQFLSYVNVVAHPFTGDVYASGGGAWGGVADDRIQVFTSDGRYVFSWETHNYSPSDLAFDSGGNIFEVSGSKVQAFAIVQIPVPVQPTTWGGIKVLFR